MTRRQLLVAVFVALFAFLAYYAFSFYFQVGKFPRPKENVCWGPGTARDQSRNVVPFKINVPEEEINDLKDRLRRFLEKPHVPPLENQGFQYGFNANYLKQIVTYWRNDYNWRKRETFLNQYQQFKTKISGLDIHFARSSPGKVPGAVKVLPLLLLHGWPSSFREFYDVIPLLTIPHQNADFVFDVVVPSLPGYGFSQGSTKTGLGPKEIAIIMKKLMERLKFEKFYVAGGDWGSVIGKLMGQYYPESVLGFYSTMCAVNTPLAHLKWVLGSIYPPLVVETEFRHKFYPVTKIIFETIKEMGYFWLQATKPDTIGTALSDTPAGLAAYILEKYSRWTNKEWMSRLDGGLTEKYSLDSLLDNIMLYWITNSITTSQRLYSEAFNSENNALERFPVTVPTACARFHHDIFWQPQSVLREIFVNLTYVSDHVDIGHFPALEEPKTFAEDIWSAVKTFERLHRGSSGQKKTV